MDEWKKNSKLDAKQLDVVADFVASFARISPDATPDEWLASPEVAKHPGLEPFQKECGSCHAIEGFTEGGTRDATGLFAWGSPAWIARMVRKPGASDRYGFLGEHQKMPEFGQDQLSENDLNMVIRYLQGDYSRPSTARAPGSGSGAPRLTSSAGSSPPTGGAPAPGRL
jgi:ubiquinol-cytochrome c reductase cytochrome b subunit